MQTLNNEEFFRLSAECRRHLKAGMFDWFAFDLKCMGALLGKEGKFKDKLKVLMLAFYIDLSGITQRPFIDRALLVPICRAADLSGLSRKEIEELYMDTVKKDATPRHIMTVKDSLHLFELCLEDKEIEAIELLKSFGI